MPLADIVPASCLQVAEPVEGKMPSLHGCFRRRDISRRWGGCRSNITAVQFRARTFFLSRRPLTGAAAPTRAAIVVGTAWRIPLDSD
jgi:hypothetical protein